MSRRPRWTLSHGIVRHLTVVVILSVPSAAVAQPSIHVDAWGVRSRPAVAVGEVAAINVVVWGINYYIRERDFASVHPKTWWSNISSGFEYDANNFPTNVHEHPYHGSAYHNAGRSNGLGFRTSVPLVLLGSFTWECCGEKHPMSLNDVANTTLGGVALGEVLYRTSSSILSNEALGAERAGRELAGLLVNPVRGVNRIVSGRAFRVVPNPADPDDRTPAHFSLDADAGYRTVRGDAQRSVEAAFVSLRLNYGSPFAGRRKGAFDVFRFEVGLYAQDLNGLGSLAIRGNLLTRDVSRGRRADHVWAVVQGFEFENTYADQFGAQTVGASFQSRWSLGRQVSLVTRVQSGAIVFGTLNSALTTVGEVPADWTLRRFDYGAGLDGRLEAEMSGGPTKVAATWRISWMPSANDAPTNGGGARHLVNQGRFAGSLRLADRLRLAGEYRVHRRDSSYDSALLEAVHRTVPEFRFYGTWSLARGRAYLDRTS